MDFLAELDHLFLAQLVLAQLRLGDQFIELIVVEVLDIDCHARAPE
jgi:hypothetical protein